jgi:hypothetical protein
MMGGGAGGKAMHRNNNSSKSASASWSMSSSSRIDTNRSTIPVPDCNCGLRTVMFRADTLKNNGRLFYTCPYHKVYLIEKFTSEIVAHIVQILFLFLFMISPFM